LRSPLDLVLLVEIVLFLQGQVFFLFIRLAKTKGAPGGRLSSAWVFAWLSVRLDRAELPRA